MAGGKCADCLRRERGGLTVQIGRRVELDDVGAGEQAAGAQMIQEREQRSGKGAVPFWNRDTGGVTRVEHVQIEADVEAATGAPDTIEQCVRLVPPAIAAQG